MPENPDRGPKSPSGDCGPDSDPRMPIPPAQPVPTNLIVPRPIADPNCASGRVLSLMLHVPLFLRLV